MNILIGYSLLLLYFLLVFLLIGGLVKKAFGVVFSRKIIHIFTGLSWFIYDYFIGCSFHQIIICAVFLLISILSRRFNIIKTIENPETKSNGTIYFSIALLFLTTLSFFIPELYPYVGFSIIALAIGDGSATLIGKCLKSPKIYHDKTLLGFIACIVFSFVGFVLYNYLYSKLFDIIELVLLSVIAGIFEEEDLKGFDNITVSLSTFAAMILFDYCENILVPICIFCGLFLICFFCKIMTYHGSLLSSFIGASFFFIGGLKAAIFAASLYIVLIVIHVIKKIMKRRELEVVKKDKEKDLLQVVANGIISLVFLYLFLIIERPILLVLSLLVFSNSFVDSIASDIGSFSRMKPYDIFKKKMVEPGVSGGMTILGTCSAVIASIIFSFAIWFLFNGHYVLLIVFPLIMMTCCFMDSLLGSLVQAKYMCETCGLITEKEEHCGSQTKLVEGFRFFDNDMVNLLCSILCGLLCIPIALIL